MRDFIHVSKPPKVRGSFFDHQLHGGGRTVGMGRFFVSPERERIEVDWAQMTVPGCTFLQHATDIAHQLGVTEFVAPDPNSSAPTCSPQSLPKVLDLGKGVTLHYGTAADACFPLLKRQAYLLRSGGCPAIVVHYPGRPWDGVPAKTGAGHGSLQSLLKNLPETLVRDMGLSAVEISESFATIIAPIHPLHFTHSTRDKKYGDKNRRMCHEVALAWGKQCVPSMDKEDKGHHLGQINLGELAVAQFEKLGFSRTTQISVLANNVDDSPRHKDGSPRWYTTRNYPMYTGKVEDEQAWKKRRNLILVTV